MFSMKRRVVTSVIVVAVIAGMLLAANVLVNQINIVELLKKIHGG
jgi:hypothetical protein